MKLSTLIGRSLTFHARSHIGVLLGAAIGSAALIGALVVGDSVRLSLKEMALSRLGQTQTALASGDRFFRAQLAEEMNAQRPAETPGTFVSAIQVQGTANTVDSSARANQVQVLGVNDSFWSFAEQPPPIGEIPEDKVVINQPLAEQLNVSVGDTFLLRVQKPSLLSRDAAISPQDDIAVAMRLEVHRIITDAELGRFSLRANQVAPFNAFVSHGYLASRIELEGRSNMMLGSDDLGPDAAMQSLAQTWQLADAELELRPVNDGQQIELRTARVFLDPEKIDAANEAQPGGERLLTYFANELWHGTNSTPYSMITAMGAPIVPDDMADDEIIINEWLAEDLKAAEGDQVSIRYYLLDAGRDLSERTNTFTVHSVIPMSGAAMDPNLMPDFPGVSDAETTRDWEAGFELDTTRIRDKDEQYWEDFRGTPKAFIRLSKGEELWANRFGEITAIRWDATGMDTNTLAAAILSHLEPGSVGLQFEPVRALALEASASGIGSIFGGLFIGFSLFLIVSSLLLMALLFQFGLEQRSPEIGTLLALGYRPREVRGLLLKEGALLGLIGGVLGAVGGIAYAKAMVYGLTSIWSEAVGSAALAFHVTPLTVVAGIFGAAVVSAVTIWFTIRKQANQPARELLTEGAEAAGQRFDARTGKWGMLIVIVLLLLALAMTGGALQKGLSDAAGDFFGVGALVLIAGLMGIRIWFAKLNRRDATRATGGAGQRGPSLSRRQLSVRNATRRSKRSVATAALLASGTFLVVAIAAFRLDANSDADQRESGTGGFALIGESSIPVTYDLNTEKGRDFYGLNPRPLADVSFVPFRVRDGDEASCLNLNMAQTPRVIGVNPQLLAGREAFTFMQSMGNGSEANPWLLLERDEFNQIAETPLADDEIPCIGDYNSLMWALQKKVGDRIEMTDEDGNTFGLRIVGAVKNSILQGNLVIDEAAFVERFPGESGYRMFLIDAPAGELEEVSATISRGLSDTGLQLTPAVDRMNAFNAVQNTYLSTFQVLGGLGLLLGSAGLGVVVLRNVLERRGELGLMLAIGFRRREMQRMVLVEHGLLLALGLGLGLITAFIAILPAVLSQGGDLPWRSLPWTLGGVLLNGILWTWVATRIALRGRLLAALRNE